MIFSHMNQLVQVLIFLKEKTEKEKINKIFNYLYEIYCKTKNSKKSILSNEINKPIFKCF